MLQQFGIHSLPYCKILDLLKLKAFADQKLYATCTVLSILGKEHRWKKRKCWYPAFSPIPTMFSKGFFLIVLNSRNCEAKA